MGKRGKKYGAVREQVDADRAYDFSEAVQLALGTSYAKFDESVDIAINLGVDPKHADQMVRGADDVAPLVRAAHLQAAAVAPAKLHEIVSLQHHVVEFQET